MVCQHQATLVELCTFTFTTTGVAAKHQTALVPFPFPNLWNISRVFEGIKCEMAFPPKVFIRAETQRLSAAGAKWLSGEDDGAG